MGEPKINFSVEKKITGMAANAKAQVKGLADEWDRLNGKPGSNQGISGSIKRVDQLIKQFSQLGKVGTASFKGIEVSMETFFKNSDKNLDKLISKVATLKNGLSGVSGISIAAPGRVQYVTTATGGGGGGGGGTPGGYNMGANGGGTMPPGMVIAPPVLGGGGNGRGGGIGGGGLGSVPPWFRKFGAGVGIAMAGAEAMNGVFQAYYGSDMKGLRYDAQRASMGGEMRGRLVSGDLSDIWNLSDPANEKLLKTIASNADNAAASQRTTDAVVGGGRILLAGAGGKLLLQGSRGVKGSTNAASTAAGVAAVAGGVGGVGQLGDSITEYTKDSPSAAAALGVKEALAAMRGKDPINMQTLQHLSGSGARWARSFRLFSGGADTLQGQANYNTLVRQGAHFGVDEGEVGSLQERMASRIGADRTNNLLRGALGSQSTWGIDRGVGADALVALQNGLGGTSGAKEKLDEVIARGMAKGFKDSKFKNDLASVIVDYSEAKGRNAVGAVGMADMMGDIANGRNGKADAYDMKVARSGMDMASNYFGNAGGAFKTIGFAMTGSAVARANARASKWEKDHPEAAKSMRMGLSHQLEVDRMSIETAKALYNGGGPEELRKELLYSLHTEDAMKDFLQDNFNLKGGLPGLVGGIRWGKYKDIKGAQKAARAGDSHAASLVARSNMINAQLMGNQMTGGTLSEVTAAGNAIDAVTGRGGLANDSGVRYNWFTNSFDEANKTPFAAAEAKGGKGTNAENQTVANANAALDIMTKISDPTITARLAKMADSAQAWAQAFTGMAKSDANPVEELNKMTGAVQKLTAAVANFNTVAGAGTITFLPPVKTSTK